MSRQLVTTGIILSRTNYGEADRILTILTQDHGRIRAMAKGVRKIKSKLAGGIELFSISQITFIKGKSDINTLISTRLKKHFGNIARDINRTMFGYEALKLINRTIEDNAGQEYFTLLANTLDGLNETSLPQDVIEMWLYAQLLKLSGHTPNLKTDSQGRRLSQDQNYSFNTEKMTFVAAPQGNFKPNHIKLLRLAFELPQPMSIGQVIGLEEVLPPNLQLTKTMLKQFIRI